MNSPTRERTSVGLLRGRWGGARVQDAVDRQIPALDELRRLGQQPDLVTVMVGSNDMCSDATARAWSTASRRCSTGALVVADMRRQGPRSWLGRPAADMFHPNDRGYAEMAAVFAHAPERSGQPPGQ